MMTTPRRINVNYFYKETYNRWNELRGVEALKHDQFALFLMEFYEGNKINSSMPLLAPIRHQAANIPATPSRNQDSSGLDSARKMVMFSTPRRDESSSSKSPIPSLNFFTATPQGNIASSSSSLGLSRIETLKFTSQTRICKQMFHNK